MALTYTPPGELGQLCPEFELESVDGKSYRLKDFSEARVLIVAFICNHCPYVQAIEDRLIALNREWPAGDARLIGICANDPAEYPEDSPKELKARWLAKNYGFPYLIDSSQTVAKAFGAVCTPDFFVFDGDRRLAYRGRLDDSWKNAQMVHQRELKMAVDAILAGQQPNSQQNPAMGCSIKWKKE